MKLPKKRRIAAVLLALLIVASGAAAYTVVFSAGGGTTYEAGSGLVVSTDTTHVMDDANPFTDSSTIYIAGVEFSASSASQLTVNAFQGPTTDLRAIDTSGTTITIDPDDKEAVKVSGAVTDLEWGDLALDGTSQITHSASGSGTIVATGLPADTNFAAATTSGEVLTSGTTTSSGEASIPVDAASNEEIVLLDPTAAQASNLDPDGSETNNENVELSFDLADQDFATDAGDSVDVDLVVDGTTVNTWTGVSSNQSLAYTVGGLTDGQHDWHVETTDAYGETSTSSTATFTVNHYAPEFNESSADPADNAELTNREQKFSIGISDIDFAEPSGDSVTATLYVDGSEAGTDTLTSNGTATVSDTISTGGSHSYYWIATDEYGNSTTSQTRSIKVPSTIQIRNISEPHDLISASGTAEITIAGSNNTVDKRTVSDGNISLENLNLDESYVIQVNTDGYYQRTVYIEDVFEQSTIFLLNENETSHDTTFAVVDNTGRYSESPKLIVESVINRSLYDSNEPEKYQWTAITGDRLGADQALATTLQDNRRYRLVVRNIEGEERVLGEYTAKKSGTITLTVGTIVWESPEGDGYKFDAYIDGDPPNETLVVQYQDVDNRTSEYTLSIYEQGNESNVLYPESTNTELGTNVVKIPLSSNQSNTTWVADWNASINGTSYGGMAPLSSVRSVDLPLDPKWFAPFIALVLIGLLSATPKDAARSGALVVAGGAVVASWFGWYAMPTPVLGIMVGMAILGKAADYARGPY